MIGKLALALLACFLAAAPATAEDIRQEEVRFGKGESGAQIAGSIKGRESVSYLLGAREGQRMTVSLSSPNTSAYFNVYAPGRGPGDEALAVGDSIGPMMTDINRFDGLLPETGQYTISVYLYRNAARDGQKADYTLDVAIDAGGAQLPGEEAAGRATGEIPCAQEPGQPMRGCAFEVVREGGGTAAVTVTLPDGRSRIIFFEAGKPLYSNASEADGGDRFAATKNDDLNVISIGDERYEIPDAVASGG